MKWFKSQSAYSRGVVEADAGVHKEKLNLDQPALRHWAHAARGVKGCEFTPSKYTFPEAKQFVIHNNGRHIMELKDQIIGKVMNDLVKWIEVKPKKSEYYAAFYCPKCTNVDYDSNHRKLKCVECGTLMAKYDEEAFRRRRRELVEYFKHVLPNLIDILIKSASLCPRPSLSWSVKNGRIEFEANHCPTRFTYEHNNTARIYYFYFDTPQHKESLEYLLAGLKHMGIRATAIIYPPHANPLLLPHGAKFEGAAYIVEL